MNNEIKPVEIKPEENAGGQAGVETSPKAPEADVDFLKLYDEALQREAKANEKAENWKRVGLAKKRGEVVEPETLTEDDVERLAEERAAQIIAQREADEAKRITQEVARKALKEIAELKIALKNSKGIVNTTSTASTGTIEVKQNPTGWTDAQLADLKRQGVDPKKAWDNYLRVRP